MSKKNDRFVKISKKDLEGDFDLDPIVVVNHKGQLFRHYTIEDKPTEVYNSKTNKWEKYVKEK